MPLTRPALIVIALLVIGCAHMSRQERQQAFEDRLASHRGEDISSILTTAGPPSSTFDMPDGRKMYTWTTKKSEFRTSSDVPDQVYSRGKFRSLSTSGDATTTEVSHSCDITYVVNKDSRIDAGQWRGDICF